MKNIKFSLIHTQNRNSGHNQALTMKFIQFYVLLPFDYSIIPYLITLEKSLKNFFM